MMAVGAAYTKEYMDIEYSESFIVIGDATLHSSLAEIFLKSYAPAYARITARY